VIVYDCVVCVRVCWRRSAALAAARARRRRRRFGSTPPRSLGRALSQHAPASAPSICVRSSCCVRSFA
jgi:hypothetical protein